jgi:hypothetical protein
MEQRSRVMEPRNGAAYAAEPCAMLFMIVI